MEIKTSNYVMLSLRWQNTFAILQYPALICSSIKLAFDQNGKKATDQWIQSQTANPGSTLKDSVSSGFYMDESP